MNRTSFHDQLELVESKRSLKSNFNKRLRLWLILETKEKLEKTFETRGKENDETKENSRDVFLFFSITNAVNSIVQTKSLILRLNDDDLRVIKCKLSSVMNLFPLH